MTFLDLCAGIGGFSLGLERAGMQCKGQVEINEFCNKILQKHWPTVPKWKDIKEIDYEKLPAVDLICGGYPCQPFSVAGKRKGEKDDRHLWPYFSKIVSTIKPSWCLFENVAGHVKMGLETVLSDLESQGYICQSLLIPACSVDAPHKRERVWILAQSVNSDRRDIQPRNEHNRKASQREKTSNNLRNAGSPNRKRVMANTNYANKPRLRQSSKEGNLSGHGFTHGSSPRFFSNAASFVWEERLSKSKESWKSFFTKHSRAQSWRAWPDEPDICRVAHGIPHRVDRITALGNAVVPQIVEILGKAILSAHEGATHAKN